MLASTGQREEWYTNFSERRLGEVRRIILYRNFAALVIRVRR